MVDLKAWSHGVRKANYLIMLLGEVCTNDYMQQKTFRSFVFKQCCIVYLKVVRIYKRRESLILNVSQVFTV